MAGSKPMRNEFGICHRLESCGKTCIWKKSVLLHTTQTTITSLLLLLHTYMTSPLIFFASLNALQEGKTENIFAEALKYFSEKVE